MIIGKNWVNASEGRVLHRLSTDEYGKGFTGNINIEDFVEILQEEYESVLALKKQKEDEAKLKEAQDNKIVELIRLKYSADGEFALHRKMFKLFSQPVTISEEDAASILDEFNQYNEYVESCKTKVYEE